MTITYTEKGPGLHRAVQAAGHALSQVDGAWISSNDAAVQAIIDSFDPLPSYKAERIEALKADGLARIQAVFPAIKSFDELALIRELYLSIAPAARQPTTNWQRMINIYTAGQAAAASINAASTKAQVDAVTPSWPV